MQKFLASVLNHPTLMRSINPFRHCLILFGWSIMLKNLSQKDTKRGGYIWLCFLPTERMPRFSRQNQSKITVYLPKIAWLNLESLGFQTAEQIPFLLPTTPKKKAPQNGKGCVMTIKCSCDMFCWSKVRLQMMLFDACFKKSPRVGFTLGWILFRSTPWLNWEVAGHLFFGIFQN